MPSFAEKADRSEASDTAVLKAMRFLADRGEQGVAWLDAELRVRERFGPFTEHLAAGVSVIASFDALVGLEEELLALKTLPGGDPLVLANVLPASTTVPGTRVSLAVYWIAGDDQFLLVVSRAVSFAEIEFRLAAETRARAIAEAEVAAQARVLQRVNQEIATANRDLEEFASVISHDLRAPLRGIRYAASDARTALLAGDPALASTSLDQALSLSRRMNAMLTGLLDYARAGRKSDVAERVQTRDIVRDIVESLDAGTDQTIEIVGHWPEITTAVEALDIVLRNLIENAVKHHDHANGRVLVHGEERAERLFITIEDDGPGIATEWHEAIFLPFRQISDADDSDGAGIGLALVKKTVERFGGTIEVQSDPSQARGTTFTIGWPLTLPA